MRQEKIEKILDTCIDIFSDTGLINFAKLVKKIRDTDGDPLAIEEFKKESSLWIHFLTEKKRRMVEFGDTERYSVMRYHLVSVRAMWYNESPAIKLNEMPDDVTLKDNPIKNVILIYETPEIRDRDYARLRLILG